jgi:hypothetical protein
MQNRNIRNGVGPVPKGSQSWHVVRQKSTLFVSLETSLLHLLWVIITTVEAAVLEATFRLEVLPLGARLP